MATRTFLSNKSSLFADGSSNLGGGNDQHMPVGGPWSGYVFRSAVRFALDFAGMKTITSAVLRMKTTDQVHVGFSSTPDFYVQRCTADWTANSASGGADGGGGWSTSPTVFPGPASTTTGRAAKRAPTGSNAQFDTDITAIVKAWAPASIPGGGAAPNYGVLLLYQASGDVTEFQSFKDPTSGDRPSIIVTYTTDTPPTATTTGPTGVVTTNRPTITATASDPDGDAITAYGIEVLQGASVVHAATAGSGPSLAYVPTADLPSGALTVHVRAQAAGVWGAYSAAVAFTVDRPPTCATPTAPVGNVSGTLRPSIVFTGADADGDPIEVYDVEVYQTSGGQPTGSPVYAPTQQSGGIAGYTVTHPPTADLPSGACAVRARVRTRGVWSTWSGYSNFTVVTANPSVSWAWPPVPGGPVLLIEYHPDPGVDWRTASFRFQADIQPPTGFTLTRIHRKCVRLDGPGAPATLVDSDATGFTPAGWFMSQPVTISGGGFVGMYATFQITIDAYSSNGGVTTVTRYGRLALTEWQGAIYLGDNVTALAVAETPGQPAGGATSPLGTSMQTTWYRAQSSKTAPVAGVPWRRYNALASIIPELPAQGAYLGVYVRVSHNAGDVDLVQNGAFDASLAPWVGNPAALVSWIPTAPSGGPGGSCGRISTDGVARWPTMYQNLAVVPGATYVVTGWGRAGASGTTQQSRIRVDGYAADGVTLITAGIANKVLPATAGLWQQVTQTFTIPADGSISVVQVLMYVDAAPALAGQIWDFDAISLVGPVPSGAGYDRITLDWTSAG